MGMAASQARYLALTARKTNVEYEGQQINQSRLILANRTADLFNQMLGLQVPTAPSSTDFTKLQYTFSDGVNDSILDSYYQIGQPDSDYNYVVNISHYEKMYTGSRKLLNDPQIQAVKTDKYSYDPTENQRNVTVRALLTPTQTGNGSYVITDSNGLRHTFVPVDNNNSEDRAKINAITGTSLTADYFSYDENADTYTYTAIDVTRSAQSVNLTSFTGAGAGNYTYNGVTYSEVDLTTLDTEDQQYKNMYAIYGSDFAADVAKVKSGGVASNKYYKSTTTESYAKNLDGTNNTTTTDIYDVTNTPSTYTRVNTSDSAQLEALMSVYGTDYDPNDSYYMIQIGGVNNYVSANEINLGKTSLEHENATVLQSNSSTKFYKDTDGNYVKESDLKNITVGSKLTFHTATYAPTFSEFSYIGNMRLTQITDDDYKKDKTISTEIEQIIEDMRGINGSTDAAEKFSKCFDENGEYIGGIYSFEMNGTTYYTTEFDLQESAQSAYDEDAIADNGIDGQQSKLAYYHAAYIDTLVTETKKALLESDGKGRFSTLKLEDDSTVYTLNVETITDEAAYNDAINQYNYKQTEYDKAITDINAKTEIIQAQDRNLELRLEQLNTEQSALQNEMEAVKKVVDKSIELGFKTFGG